MISIMKNGNITNKRTIINVPKEEGFPDGMTIDNEGMLWIAHWGGWQVTRWNPKTGKKLSAIKLPVSNVTSCTFGGESMEDLYITSARKGLSVRGIGKTTLGRFTYLLSGNLVLLVSRPISLRIELFGFHPYLIQYGYKNKTNETKLNNERIGSYWIG